MPKEIHPNYIPNVDLPEPDPNSPVSQFLYGPIDGRRIVKRSLTLSQLNFIPLESVSGKKEIVATINASEEGIKITSSLIKIDGSVEFSSGYNPIEKVDELGGNYASAESGARVKIFPSSTIGLQVIDDAEKDVLKAIVGGADVGDVIIGDYVNTKGCKWDKSAGSFKVKGNLEQVDGYANISDKPTCLADINSDEGSNLNTAYNHAIATGNQHNTDLIDLNDAQNYMAREDTALDSDGFYKSKIWTKKIVITEPSTEGLIIDKDGIRGYATDLATQTFGYNVNSGDIFFGKLAGHYLKFTETSGVMELKGSLLITGGSGYGNLSDKPIQLADINSGEGSKLSGVESGADVTASHQAASISGQGALATKNQVGTSDMNSGALARLFSAQSDRDNIQAWQKAGSPTYMDGEKILVNSLSAISANIGTCTAGILRGVQIETAASGQRIILYSTTMNFYNSSNQNVANIYAGANDLLIKNQLTSKNIFIDAGSGGYVTLGTGGTIRMQVGATTIQCRQGISPYSTDSYALGLATKRWTNLYLKDGGRIYAGGSYGLKLSQQYYSGYYDTKLEEVADVLPGANNIWELGSSTKKWYKIWRTNEGACDMPTSNSAIDVIKKIKAPEIANGDYGERHYFKDKDFPDEMKMFSTREEEKAGIGKREIEFTRTLGITVQAIREILEKVEKLEQKVEPK
jgi:hypothetical protein